MRRTTPICIRAQASWTLSPVCELDLARSSRCLRSQPQSHRRQCQRQQLPLQDHQRLLQRQLPPMPMRAPRLLSPKLRLLQPQQTQRTRPARPKTHPQQQANRRRQRRLRSRRSTTMKPSQPLHHQSPKMRTKVPTQTLENRSEGEEATEERSLRGLDAARSSNAIASICLFQRKTARITTRRLLYVFKSVEDGYSVRKVHLEVRQGL